MTNEMWVCLGYYSPCNVMCCNHNNKKVVHTVRWGARLTCIYSCGPRSASSPLLHVGTRWQRSAVKQISVQQFLWATPRKWHSVKSTPVTHTVPHLNPPIKHIWHQTDIWRQHVPETKRSQHLSQLSVKRMYMLTQKVWQVQQKWKRCAPAQRRFKIEFISSSNWNDAEKLRRSPEMTSAPRHELEHLPPNSAQTARHVKEAGITHHTAGSFGPTVWEEIFKDPIVPLNHCSRFSWTPRCVQSGLEVLHLDKVPDVILMFFFVHTSMSAQNILAQAEKNTLLPVNNQEHKFKSHIHTQSFCAFFSYRMRWGCLSWLNVPDTFLLFKAWIQLSHIYLQRKKNIWPSALLQHIFLGSDCY